MTKQTVHTYGRRLAGLALACAFSFAGLPAAVTAHAAPNESTAVQADINVEKIEGLSNDFIKGADVSTAVALEDAGIQFRNAQGKVDDIFNILKEGGTNYVRVRVWNNPADKQGNTYGAGKTGVDMAVHVGKRATAVGMKVLVDFHYSDFWADPGKYKAPKAWDGMSLEEKSAALSDFTQSSLRKFVDAGVNVGMVQVGNEINGGTAGEKSGSAAYFALLKAGSAAVRKVLPNALVAIHYANPEKGLVRWAKNLDANKVDYDVFGSSYYPAWHGTTQNLTKELNAIINTYGKKVMVAETSWSYTFDDPDGGNMIKNTQGIATPYDISVQGQADEIRDVAQTVHNLDKNAGLGLFWWEPAWLPVTPDAQHTEGNNYVWNTTGGGWATQYAAEYDPGAQNEQYGGSGVDNQAWFDDNGYVLPSLYTYAYLSTGAVSSTVTPEKPIEDEAVETEKPSEDTRNLVKNPDFAQGEESWTVNSEVPTPGDGQTGVWIGKTNNALPADGNSINFWNDTAFSGYVTQRIEGLQPGSYVLSAALYGGDSNDGTVAQLIASTSVKPDYAQNFSFEGWQKASQRQLAIDVGQDGTATVGFRIDSKNGKEWGSVNAFRLVSTADATQPEEPAETEAKPEPVGPWVHAIDKTALTAALEKAKTVDTSLYEKAGVDILSLVRAHAQRVLDYKDSAGRDATQASVDVATRLLMNAVNALVALPSEEEPKQETSTDKENAQIASFATPQNSQATKARLAATGSSVVATWVLAFGLVLTSAGAFSFRKITLK